MRMVGHGKQLPVGTNRQAARPWGRVADFQYLSGGSAMWKWIASALVVAGLTVGCGSSPDAEGGDTEQVGGGKPTVSLHGGPKKTRTGPEENQVPDAVPKPEKPKPKPPPLPVDARGSVYGLPLEITVPDIEVPEKLKGPTPMPVGKPEKSQKPEKFG